VEIQTRSSDKESQRAAEGNYRTLWPPSDMNWCYW
jgi:hypothetical protein